MLRMIVRYCTVCRLQERDVPFRTCNVVQSVVMENYGPSAVSLMVAKCSTNKSYMKPGGLWTAGASTASHCTPHSWRRIPSLVSLLFVYWNVLPALRRLRAETAGLVRSRSGVRSGRIRRAVHKLEVSGRWA
jgi:hypothetical protein